ncbi:MAG: hypothetical protein AAF570_08125, partial [Bacteroidota bacterium]
MNKIYIILLAFGLVIGQGIAGAGITHNGLYAQSKGKKGGKKGGKKKGKKGKNTNEPDPKKKARIDYLFIEANTQYLQQKKQEAIKLFEEILTIDPSHHASLYNIGKIYNELEQFSQGDGYAKDALALNPENAWYYKELIVSYEGQLAFDKALDVQKRLCEKFPEDKDAQFDLAQLYIANKQF